MIFLFLNLNKIPGQHLHFLVKQIVLLDHKLVQLCYFLPHSSDFQLSHLNYLAQFVHDVNELDDELCRFVLMEIVGEEGCREVFDVLEIDAAVAYVYLTVEFLCLFQLFFKNYDLLISFLQFLIILVHECFCMLLKQKCRWGIFLFTSEFVELLSVDFLFPEEVVD